MRRLSAAEGGGAGSPCSCSQWAGGGRAGWGWWALTAAIDSASPRRGVAGGVPWLLALDSLDIALAVVPAGACLLFALQRKRHVSARILALWMMNTALNSCVVRGLCSRQAMSRQI